MRFFLTFLASSLVAGYTNAGFMLTPVSATTSIPTNNLRPVSLMIDQSGLSANYTSGVTDFATYTSTATHASGNFLANCWVAVDFNTSGKIDFSLGGVVNVEALALWVNAGDSGIKDFSLSASQDSTFNSAVNLGSFTAKQTDSAQVFSFATTSASYIRLDIANTQGRSFGAVIGEVAFRQQGNAAVVPEPASIASFIFFALAGGLIRMRRHGM